MVRPGLKRKKKVQRKIPSGKPVTRYRRGMHSKHKCGVCGGVLHGTPRGKPIQIKRLKKSRRSPERPYGGQLCSSCTRKVVAMKAKLKHKVLKEDEVPISLKRYL